MPEDSSPVLNDEPKEDSSAILDALRLRVALRHHLSETLADRLQGATEAELTADAQRLRKAISEITQSGGASGAKRPSAPSPTHPASETPLSADDLRALSPEAINARWADVRRLLRGG
ncbi:MAG TPA: hypothetical protein PLD47_18115 [Aggregatilineales bacterium]|nr:hypothetical protein [Anaerolineales bacterium]HRE49645.1 hypothetical protein [Aggregatilineales bacterium]